MSNVKKNLYKIVLNGQGGYFFCSLLNREIIDYWLNNKSIELMQEYVLAHYMQDDEIDEEWRIPKNLDLIFLII